MEEAEKIEVLSPPETPVAGQPEASDYDKDIFDQLEALISRDSFDLRGKIKKSKGIDPQVKKEMLNYIDEAQGQIAIFKNKGFSVELVREAAGYFNVLQEMREKHIPGFEKKITEYNGKAEARNSMLEKNRPGSTEKGNNPDQPEQEKFNHDDKGAEEKSSMANNNNQNIMNEKTESSSNGHTLSEQLEAIIKNGKIDKIIKPEKPRADNAAIVEAGLEQITTNTNEPLTAESIAEAAKDVVINNPLEEAGLEKDDKKPVGGKGGVNNEEPPDKGEELAEKIVEIEKKMAIAYKDFFRKRITTEQRNKIIDDAERNLFNIYKKEKSLSPKEASKKAEDFRESVYDRVDQERSEAKEKRAEIIKEKKTRENELKETLDKNYKKLYEEYVNLGKNVPDDLMKLIKREKRALESVWGKKSNGGKLTDALVDEFRGKYKKDLPKEARNKRAHLEQDRESEKGGKEELKKPITEAKREEPKISDDLIDYWAYKIRRRRENNEPGFEWNKIDQTLKDNGLEPGTPSATEFMEQWDKVTAKTELDKMNNSEIAALEKEFAEVNLARVGKEITLSKITNYDELRAETEQEGDEKFKEKTRELWKEFAVHNVVGKNNEGKPVMLNFTDLDGKCSLGLLKLAGIKTGEVKYIPAGEHVEGRINLDTGYRHGVVFEDKTGTVFIDHHADDSGNNSSATKFTYELLVSLGLLKKEEYLDKLIDFVTQLDNKTFPNEEKYFKDSWRTILGLDQFLQFENLANYLKEGRKPTDILSEDDIKKIGGKHLFEKSREQKKKVESSLAELERMEKNGLIVPSRQYGKIAVDIEKKVSAGFDAAKAVGCGVYLIWSPQENSFFISSAAPLKETFKQGKKVRDNMWIKPRGDGIILSMLLEKDVLSPMTDGRLEPTGELAEFLANEGKEKKTELPPEIFGFLKSAKDEFYQELQKEARGLEGWGKYSESDQKILLQIETKTFLRDLAEKEFVPRNLVAKNSIEKVVESLMDEKTVEPQETERPLASEIENQGKSREEYIEIFKDKSDKELTALLKQALGELGEMSKLEVRDLMTQTAAAAGIVEARRRERENKEEKEPVANLSKKKWQTYEEWKKSVEEHRKSFEEKSDEELAILKEQIKEKMFAASEEEKKVIWVDGHATHNTFEYEDLFRQVNAIVNIQEERIQEERRKGAADSLSHKEMISGDYLEIFKNKSDEELVVLKKQIDKQIKENQTEEDDIKNIDLALNLLDQKIAISNIQGQRRKEKLGY